MFEALNMIKNGDVPGVKKFFTSDDYKVSEIVNRYCWTPLHYAVMKN